MKKQIKTIIQILAMGIGLSMITIPITENTNISVGSIDYFIFLSGILIFACSVKLFK